MPLIKLPLTCINTFLHKCRAETKANVPQAFAFQMFEDRESIPKYMSWIQDVKVCPP